ncbi:MAG TPA: hypothetical protein GX715_13420 [Armatimonadetes bacterium]|jgi:hypothetical protein|nr:hypothetical protein [Armatimonadota bacterium]
MRRSRLGLICSALAANWQFLSPRLAGPAQALCLALVLLSPGAATAFAAEAEVAVDDSGVRSRVSTSQGHAGHRWEERTFNLNSGAARYAFRYSACVDPSHGDSRPAGEGSLGMPVPSSTNWYHSGFLFLSINGKEATTFPLSDSRVLEKGARGSFQMVFEHPDAVVGLRALMLPGANHVLMDLTWTPRTPGAVKSARLKAICYPSFFTSWHKRKGDRHCMTPRIDEREPKTLELDPAADGYLYYYDTIFDVARGEGDGPCALIFTPEGVQSGQVAIGNYAVITTLTLKPDAGRVRLAFYDFTGKKNAEAEAYLKAHGLEDRDRLAKLDFRPEEVRTLQVAQFEADAARYLADAGEDGKPFQPKVESLLTRVKELKAKADANDWRAEAELAGLLFDSQDLFWKLRIAALLNAP